MTMRKLNVAVYGKLLLQGEEAKEQGMEALGNAVMRGIGPSPETDMPEKYSWGELDRDVYEGLWKLAVNVIGYHGLESADIEKMNEAICVLANKFVGEIESALGVDGGVVGPRDEVLGEIKKEK